jgi:hypothetical protein
MLGREEPIHVYGPIGLQVMTDHILSACAEDIRERLEGLLILKNQLFHGVTEAELFLENRRVIKGTKFLARIWRSINIGRLCLT